MQSLQPKIPEIGSEFLAVESFKKAVQESAKIAGFAFNISSSKMTRSEKKKPEKELNLQSAKTALLDCMLF
ncbi:20551_t:CDS:2, partial [Dentiscutata erythropus]